METLAFTVVCIGLCGLLGSMRSAYKIATLASYQHEGWQWLFSLVCFFVFGYLGYLWALTQHEIHAVDIVVSALLCGGGGFVFIITRMSKHTILELKQMVDEKHYQAYHDPLTKLPNRVFFYEKLEELLQDSSHSFFCMILDLDNFKVINDTYGHEHGDMVLQTVGERISSILPGNTMAARIGGDELAILFSSDKTEEALEVALSIQKVLAIPLNCGNYRSPVQISIGITQYPQDGDTRKALLVNADTAMYQAKCSEQCYQFYHSEMEHPKVVNRRH